MLVKFLYKLEVTVQKTVQGSADKVTRNAALLYIYSMNWSFYPSPPWMTLVLSPPDTVTAVCTRCFSFS